MSDESMGAGGRTYSVYVRCQGRGNCFVPSVSPIRFTVHSPLLPLLEAEQGHQRQVSGVSFVPCPLCHQYILKSSLQRKEGKTQAGELRVTEHYVKQ